MKYQTLLFSIICILCVSCINQSEDISHLPSHIQRQKADPTPEQIEIKQELISKRKQQRLKKSKSGILQNVTERGPNKDGLSLYGSINFGAPYFYSGMVKDIAIHRNDPNTIVVATETSGAWLCVYDGSEFQCSPIDDDHAETRWETVVQHPDPNQPNIFYFGGTFEGLYYTDISTNDGMIQYVGNIDGVPNESFDNVNVLSWDENDPSTFFIAAGLYGTNDTKTFNVYRFNSIDNSFINISSSLTTNTDSRFGEIEILNDGSVVVCRIQHFYKLKNGSDAIGTGLISSYDTEWGQYMLLAAHDNIVYSMIYILEQEAIRFYRSLDHGDTWNYVDVLTKWSQKHDQALEVFNTGENQHLLLAGTIDGFTALVDNTISDNTDPIGLKLMNFGHKDFHGFEKGGDYIYAYNDGGLFRAGILDIKNSIGSSGFANFPIESVNKNLPTLQTNSIWFKEDSDEAVLGFWHNGSALPNGGIYDLVSGGDGFDVAIAPGQDSKIYTTSQNGNIFRNGTIIHYGDDSIDPFKTQIFVDPNWPNRLYYVNPKEGIKRVNNAHNCSSCFWEYIFEGDIDLFTKTITPADPYFYFTRKNGNQISFYRIDNLNAPFSDVQLEVDLNISLSIPNVEQIDLFKHPDHPNGTLFLIVKNGSSDHSIYKVENAHDDNIQTIVTEIADFSDFENLSVTELFIADCQASQIIVGTEYGLFSSSDSGQSFQAELTLPAVEITDLVFKSANDKLFIATFGRGAWMANVNATECNNPFIISLEYSYSNCESFGGAVMIPINVLSDLTVLSDPSGNINFTPNGTGYASANNLVPGIYEFEINGELFSFEILEGCGICVCPNDVAIECNNDMLSMAVSLAIWAEPIKQCIASGSEYSVLTNIVDNTIITSLTLPDVPCISEFSIIGDTNCDVFDMINTYNSWIDNHFPDPINCELGPVRIDDDSDKFIDGTEFIDDMAFATIKPDVSTYGAIIKNVELNLYFRTIGLSCANDIIIELVDPAGNQYTFTDLFNTDSCNPQQLLNVQVQLPTAYTLGNGGTWKIYYRNETNANSGAEFSVRYAGIMYDSFQSDFDMCSETTMVVEYCPQSAPELLQLDTTELHGNYFAKTLIQSNGGTIADAYLKSGQIIELAAGFIVEENTTFSAEIMDCSNDH